MLTPHDILTAAADLLSVDGENPEYDRALVELSCALLGMGTDDHRESISLILRHYNRAAVR
jgi:hypothetical protein